MRQANVRIVLLIFAFVSTITRAQAQGPPSGAGNASIANRVAALEARVAKLEGQITSSDLAGTYTLNGFQTELRAKVQDGFTAVSSYVFQGTFVLNADGTGSSVGTGAEIGHSLGLFIGTPTFIPPSRTLWNKPGGGFTFSWSYANGVATVSGIPLGVAAGGRVLVGTGTNPADGTTVILVMTRLQ
jgi:hypothetical protein